MSNSIEQSIRMFLDSDSQRFFTFSKHRPAKGQRQPRREAYKYEVDDELDDMDSSVITIEDVLGPSQTRKIFSDGDVPVAMPDAVMTQVSDDEAPHGQRSCKLCNTGDTLMTCNCEACEAWRVLGNQLAMKRSVPWTNALDVIERFCKRQRTVEGQYSEPGVIPGSASAAPREETSKGGVGEIPTPHPGAPSFSAASHDKTSKSGVGEIPTSPPGESSSAAEQPEERAEPVPKHLFKDILLNQRRFDEAEDGTKYANRGPPTLRAFSAETKEAQGHVQDWGMDIISQNCYEHRYGPKQNPEEYFTTIGRYKQSPYNTVVIIDCDQDLLAVKFRQSHFDNWTGVRYSKSRLNDLSRFYSGFLRHWGCLRKGSMNCDSG